MSENNIPIQNNNANNRSNPLNIELLRGYVIGKTKNEQLATGTSASG